MKSVNRLSVILLVLFVLTAVASADMGRMDTPVVEKLQNANDSQLIPIIVLMAERPDIEGIRSLVDGLPRNDRSSVVWDELDRLATSTQKDLLEYLAWETARGRAEDVHSIRLCNGVKVDAVPEVIQAISQRRDVYLILDNEEQQVVPEMPEGSNPNELDETAWGVTTIGAPDVWDMGYTGAGVLVAIIDTGVNYNHVDLNDHMWNGGVSYPNHGYDFYNNDNNPMDDNGHGTHCSGTICGDGTAGNQTGVAPDATLMAIKTLSSGGSGDRAQTWQGMDFALQQGADIISMSLGWWYETDADRATWRANFDALDAGGLISCVAAGNEQYSGPPNSVRTPGNVPSPWANPDDPGVGGRGGVITIGATDINDVIAGFSSIGYVTWGTVPGYNDWVYPPGMICPDVSAPGVNILSLNYANNTGYLDGWDGTSMATPHTAGLVALLLSFDPNLTPIEVDFALQSSALDLGSAGKDNYYGAGRIQAVEAIVAAGGQMPPAPPTNLSAVISDEVNGTVDLTWSAPALGLQGSNGGAAVEQPISINLADRDGMDRKNPPEEYFTENRFRAESRDAFEAGLNIMSSDDAGVGSELDEFQYYNIYRDDVLIGTSTTTDYTDQLPAFGTYTYRVTAFYDEGESFSSNPASVNWIDWEAYLLLEDFENGLPVNWTVIDADGGGVTWALETGTGLDQLTPNYMMMDGDAAYYGGGDDYLLTPILDCSDRTNVALSFDHYFMDYEGESGYVLVSNDGGATWTEVFSVFAVDYGAYPEVIDISALADGQSQVQISFHYDDNGGWGWYWGVDNVAVTGTLNGGPTGLVISLSPVNPPIVVPAGGGNFQFDATITNNNAYPVVFDAWTEAILPNGNVYGPILLSQGLTLNAGQTMTPNTLTQNVPGYAPAGGYIYVAKVGSYPGLIEDSDSFTFTKNAVGVGASVASDWAISGWDDVADAVAPVPETFSIERVYPNPFNPTTSVTIALPEASELTVAVYNMMGQQAALLAGGRFASGYHTFTFDGNGLSSGIYFVRATVPGRMNEIRKLMLLK